MSVPHRLVAPALAAAALLIGTTAVPAAGTGRPLPGTYVVSRTPGTLPEGIDVRPDGTLYVSSDGTGALYRGRVTSPRMRPFPAEGATSRGSTRGVHTDRAGRVLSVGRDRLTVHAPDGRLLQTVDAPDGPLGAPDLNDLVVTRDAVYVTDWANPVVLRASLRNGRVGPLEPWADVRGAFPGFPDRYWLLNGIVADPAGRTLLVASNGTEAVWRIDTATRAVSRLDLGEESFGADGMVLHGRTLYAVLNYGAPHGVYIARLDADLRTGTVVHRVTGAPFDLPTTLARHACRLYVVNSQNDEPPGTPPYTVTALDDPMCGAGG
ncbi:MULTISPECIES: SMP-30/gluconolactonase/LRE family protein [unclassified Streptomyces]|uniref:SMP-30/gluconolactonase/LRE family protein n=1 Tax=Streptomyces sp. NPDC057412 TaxID=3346123 RepID=UPI003691DDE1